MTHRLYKGMKHCASATLQKTKPSSPRWGLHLPPVRCEYLQKVRRDKPPSEGTHPTRGPRPQGNAWKDRRRWPTSGGHRRQPHPYPAFAYRRSHPETHPAPSQQRCTPPTSDRLRYARVSQGSEDPQLREWVDRGLSHPSPRCTRGAERGLPRFHVFTLGILGVSNTEWAACQGHVRISDHLHFYVIARIQSSRSLKGNMR